MSSSKKNCQDIYEEFFQIFHIITTQYKVEGGGGKFVHVFLVEYTSKIMLWPKRAKYNLFVKLNCIKLFLSFG